MSIWKLWNDATSSPVSNAIVMGFILVSLILIAVYIAGWVRRLALGKDEEPLNPFAHIEQLRDEGQISQEEYQRMRKLISESLSPAMLLLTKGGGKKWEADLEKRRELKSKRSPEIPGLPQESRIQGDPELADTPDEAIDFIATDHEADEDKEQM